MSKLDYCISCFLTFIYNVWIQLQILFRGYYTEKEGKIPNYDDLTEEEMEEMRKMWQENA